jgi:hypothetical protein
MPVWGKGGFAFLLEGEVTACLQEYCKICVLEGESTACLHVGKGGTAFLLEGKVPCMPACEERVHCMRACRKENPWHAYIRGKSIYCVQLVERRINCMPACEVWGHGMLVEICGFTASLRIGAKYTACCKKADTLHAAMTF